MNKYMHHLKQLSIFKDISEQELDDLFKKLPLTERQYKKGMPIMLQGSEYRELHILLTGYCYGEITDVTGKTITVEDFHPPSVLASAVLFASQNSMPGSVFAKTDCDILKIKKEHILTLCSANRQFLHNFLKLISDKFLFVSQKLTFLSFKTIQEKLAHYLLSLKETAGGGKQFLHSLEELADFFGVSRPSLSRVLIQLENQGIISRSGKNVVIKDKGRLIENR